MQPRAKSIVPWEKVVANVPLPRVLRLRLTSALVSAALRMSAPWQEGGEAGALAREERRAYPWRQRDRRRGVRLRLAWTRWRHLRTRRRRLREGASNVVGGGGGGGGGGEGTFIQN